MSDNIGGIIKLVAVILCVLGIVFTVIGAFTLGFGVLISGCCSSLIVAFFVYGFGHLIDETSLNRQINQQILQFLKENEKKNQTDGPRDVPVAFNSERPLEGALRARNVAASTADGWLCKKCGSKNPTGVIQCRECDAYK